MRAALFVSPLGVSLLAVSLAACSPPAGGDGGVVDAGPVQDDEDAGSSGPDAGAGLDAGTPGGDAGPDGGARTHGLEGRVENTTCKLTGAPSTTVPTLQMERVFAGVDFPGAVTMVPLPGRREVVAVRKTGQVQAIAIDGAGAQARAVVDLSTLVNSTTAPGLLSAVFSEDGAALFVAYVPVGQTTSVVVSRMPIAAGVATTTSNVVLKTFTGAVDTTRAAGTLLMRDGMLHVVLGDAGTASAASDKNSPWGKVLRYDARNLSATTLTVPTDGPFFGDALTLGELYALGFANPRCAMDRAVGRLWCADIGGATTDEVNVVVAGTSYGWPHMEGVTCKDAHPSCTDGSLPEPLSYVARAECGRVIGPLVRSGRVAELQGMLPMAGVCGTTMRGTRTDGRYIFENDPGDTTIATIAGGFAAFGEDEDGEVYVVDDAGLVFRFIRPAAATAPTFPVTLTQTGCYEDVARRRLAASLIPFEVRSPLWSDGAVKERFIALPGTTKIGFTQTGAWTLPDGAILVKEFLLDDDGSATTAAVPMETRFLVKRSATVWEGFSYIWNRAGTEGYLVDGTELVDFPRTGAAAAGGPHIHTYPSRSDCLLCHNANAGRVLGLQTGRMNVDHDYDGFVDNQLAAMNHVGLFDPALTALPDALPRWADHLDTTAPLADRARGYLAGNCAHCHQPNGPVTPTIAIDLRYETSFAGTRTCDVVPTLSVPINNAKIIDPGASATSELFYRIARRGAYQMPPIATLILDDEGEDVVKAWIDGLTACP